MVKAIDIVCNLFTREVSVGAPSTQWWGALASAIVFGMGFATILTLIVTPSALQLRGNFQDWRAARRARKAGRAQDSGIPMGDGSAHNAAE